MVAGQVGVDGRLARKPVQPVLNNVLEAARDRVLVMAGNLALGVSWKDERATSNLALVRNETFREVTELFQFSLSAIPTF